jgi:hypothetical protein
MSSLRQHRMGLRGTRRSAVADHPNACTGGGAGMPCELGNQPREGEPPTNFATIQAGD